MTESSSSCLQIPSGGFTQVSVSKKISSLLAPFFSEAEAASASRGFQKGEFFAIKVPARGAVGNVFSLALTGFAKRSREKTSGGSPVAPVGEA